MISCTQWRHLDSDEFSTTLLSPRISLFRARANSNSPSQSLRLPSFILDSMYSGHNSHDCWVIASYRGHGYPKATGWIVPGFGLPVRWPQMKIRPFQPQIT